MKPRFAAGGDLALQIDPQWDWPEFWAHLHAVLKQQGYRRNSRKQYRNVLRGLRGFCRCRPAQVTARHVREHLHHLGRRRLSRSWIGTNVCIVRNVFDRICARQIAGGLRCPKPARTLPEILGPDEVRAILAKAPTLRDQLLLGLLYGCGLKVGELVELRWGDIDTEQGTLRVGGNDGEPGRLIGLPRRLRPLLTEGVRRCPPDGFVFVGRREGAHLSVRMAEYVVQRAAHTAALGVPVTALTLRHCYAVHALEAGMNIRRLQETLGHRHIETTLRYQQLLAADGTASPLDPFRPAAPAPSPSESEGVLVEPFEEPLLPGPLLSLDTFLTAAEALYASLRTQLSKARFLARRAGGRGRKPG